MDVHTLSDAELNEAIAKKKGIIRQLYLGEYHPNVLPDYTHDWNLAGGLLEEIDIPFLRVERMAYSWTCYDGVSESGIYAVARTPQRAICEAWLEWKGK